MPRFAVILPAAGRSSRFQSAEKKVFADLDGRAVWLRSADWFMSRPDVCQCVVVTAPEDREVFRRHLGSAMKDNRIQLADGGAERFESVANALALTTSEADFVAVHDAARPCLTAALIDAVFARAVETGAALLAVPVADTIKRDDGAGRIQATVARQALWLAQTPQVFRRDWLIDAYARRAAFGVGVTDDAQLVEAAGHAVYLVSGSSANLKITTREDLDLAAAILRGRQLKAKITSRKAAKSQRILRAFAALREIFSSL
jgi:2-C-methyl-D-erythritol 4-phosphate cytidylyltransferase